MKTLLLALALYIPFPSAADDEEPMSIPGMVCRGEFCIIQEKVMDALIDAHNKLVRENRELEAKRPPATCAKVEPVDPPKKPTPPLKRENDS